MFDQEVESANCFLKSDSNYLNFPASTILTPQKLTMANEHQLKLYEKVFDDSNQKNDVLSGFTNAMQAKAIPKTLQDDAISVVDELFTNALFNAPFVDIHTHKNPGMSRQGHIKLTDGKRCRVFLAQESNRLVVGCHDPYGSLELYAYMKRIRATYQNGAGATMNFGAGGAGLGSYIIFNAGSSLYFAVWPGQATVLCCVIPLGISNRRRSELVKHLHWVQR
jgi:hypothetical protein